MGDWHLFTGVVTDNGNKGYYDCNLMTNYIFGGQNTSLFFADAVKKEIIMFGKGYWGNGDYQGMDTKFFDGMIDDVRVYNRPLTEQEIEELYDMTTPVIKNNYDNQLLLFKSYMHGGVLHLGMTDQLKADITLFSPSGRCVFEIKDRFLHKGNNHVSVPAHIGGGVYIIRISGKYLDQRQQIVLK